MNLIKSATILIPSPLVVLAGEWEQKREARKEQGLAVQKLLNKSPVTDKDTTKAMARSLTNDYRPERWDGWQMYVVPRKIVTKMGVAFEEGDVTIAKISEWPQSIVAFSFRNGCDTQL